MALALLRPLLGSEAKGAGRPGGLEALIKPIIEKVIREITNKLFKNGGFAQLAEKEIVSQAASGLANASRKAKARRANLPVRARAKAVTMGLPLRSLTMLAMMMTTRSRPKASAGGGRGCGRQLDGGAPYAPCVEAARAGRE